MKVSLLFYFLSISFGGICQDSTQYSISLSEQLINNTIKIQATKDSSNGKKYTVTGTGFYFNFSIGKDSIQVIVTNAHIIKNCKTGIFKFNSTNVGGKPNYGDILSIKIKNFDKLWIMHPSEDLAIFPLMPVIKEIIKNQNKVPFHVLFSEGLIPSEKEIDEFAAIEEVLMIGYPKGFSDTVNNIPVVRRGITATPLFLNYNNQKRFLLDIPVFSGSSGSPIMIFNLGMHTNKAGTTIVGPRTFFIGIAVESETYIAIGSTVSNKPELKMETNTRLPLNIAIAIKSSEIFAFKPLLNKLIHDKNYTHLFESSIK